MKFKFFDDIKLHIPERISKADADRQQQTAIEILRRLDSQPGVILADEVGMGKTYVALAVAVSAHLSDPKRRPAVVMVPSGLSEKWPREFQTFVSGCLPQFDGPKLRYKVARRCEDFLRALDDGPQSRAAVVFLTHGAMARGLGDPWVKLAILQRALLNGIDVEKVRNSLRRFAGELLSLAWAEDDEYDIWADLLGMHVSHWGDYLRKWEIYPSYVDDDSTFIDDPVPLQVIEALETLKTDEILEALRSMPQRDSSRFNEHLKLLKQTLNSLMQSLWQEVMASIRLKLPLLILDEAHHLKNAKTRTASLFHSKESSEDANSVQNGVLASVFERMVFLTATPFQLGHNELISVLHRFEGIDWATLSAISRDDYKGYLKGLLEALDASQAEALKLDRVWGSLTQVDLVIGDRRFLNVDEWWAEAIHTIGELSKNGSIARDAFRATKKRMKVSEDLLRQYVIRHTRPRYFQFQNKPILRRENMEGAAILTDRAPSGVEGLRIEENCVLPFLLAARAVSCSPESRPVFAEGLSSSYEAFLDTRARKATAALDSDDEDGAENASTEESLKVLEEQNSEQQKMQWYLKQIENSLPRAGGVVTAMHPKVSATVDRVIDLWRRGEKVLIFCHYIETGKALRGMVSRRISQIIEEMAADRTGLSPVEAMDRIEKIRKQLAQPAKNKKIESRLSEVLLKYPDLALIKDDLASIFVRMIRTPTFLVRYYPIEKSDIDVVLGVDQALASQDASGASFQQVLDQFLHFLSKRCELGERKSYIDALLRVQTGSHAGEEAEKSYSDDEIGQAGSLVANVRLANGSTKHETRQRLMLTFNTPFYPEILIASSVMAEGVDLHLNCRHIIHHDLSWNPSTLEQRTGRVDRIGSKMESTGRSIQVYLPFVAETQDEKMFRVVMDRERWFKVVMGDKFKVDARTTEIRANRLPFPESAAEDLQFKLEVASHLSASRKAG